MARIQPVDRGRLDPESLALLDSINGGNGVRWNVFEGVANNPASLRAMDALRKGVDACLTTLEQEVIAIEIARFNGCGYCLPAHRYVCDEIGMNREDIDALTRGEDLAHQPGLMTIQKFVRSALQKKGHLGDEEFDALFAEGIDSAKMIAILTEIALYTLLNYFNRLAGSEIEADVLPFVSDEADWITEPDR